MKLSTFNNLSLATLLAGLVLQVTAASAQSPDEPRETAPAPFWAQPFQIWEWGLGPLGLYGIETESRDPVNNTIGKEDDSSGGAKFGIAYRQFFGDGWHLKTRYLFGMNGSSGAQKELGHTVEARLAIPLARWDGWGNGMTRLDRRQVDWNTYEVYYLKTENAERTWLSLLVGHTSSIFSDYQPSVDAGLLFLRMESGAVEYGDEIKGHFDYWSAGAVAQYFPRAGSFGLELEAIFPGFEDKHLHWGRVGTRVGYRQRVPLNSGDVDESLSLKGFFFEFEWIFPLVRWFR